MSAHPAHQPLRSPAQRAELASIRQGIEAGHPLLDVLEAVEAAAHDPLRWDAETMGDVGELLTLAAGIVDGWFDGAAERSFGARVDQEMENRT